MKKKWVCARVQGLSYSERPSSVEGQCKRVRSMLRIVMWPMAEFELRTGQERVTLLRSYPTGATITSNFVRLITLGVKHECSCNACSCHGRDKGKSDVPFSINTLFRFKVWFKRLSDDF